MLVPEFYFSPLEVNGRRHDASSRPELCRGTVEFVATKEYCEHPPTPLKYLFVMDVSQAAVASGTLAMCVSTIKAILSSKATELEVGFITFDNSVHFYNLNVYFDFCYSHLASQHCSNHK